MRNLAIAIDFGASNLRVALVSQEGKILSKKKEETLKEGSSGTVITKQIVRLIHSLLEENKIKKVKGIGISSIGPLNYKRGGPENSPNIPFAFVPLVQPLQKEFSVPVLLYNDGNAAVLGEKQFGAGKNIQNLVYVTISTGIGGGAIVDGKLLLGKGGNAAEVGHFIVDTHYNIPCTCGAGVGHWEGLASGRNIPRFFETWIKQQKKIVSFEAKEAKDIFEVAKNGDAAALEFLEELAKINGRAISNIIAGYDPELITLGGSVGLNNPKIILAGITKYIDHFLKSPKILITKLGEDIVLLGAAALVFEKKLGRQR
ncbi:MAG: ROK family protein [Candidatus Wildermuthbacteria bacterium]|nr:ROK family protein [Candidatus Wildermuthbacteria bacterium]